MTLRTALATEIHVAGKSPVQMQDDFRLRIPAIGEHLKPYTPTGGRPARATLNASLNTFRLDQSASLRRMGVCSVPRLNSRCRRQYSTAELIQQGFRESRRLLSYLRLGFQPDSVSCTASQTRDSVPSLPSVKTSKRLAPAGAAAPAGRGTLKRRATELGSRRP